MFQRGGHENTGAKAIHKKSAVHIAKYNCFKFKQQLHCCYDAAAMIKKVSFYRTPTMYAKCKRPFDLPPS